MNIVKSAAICLSLATVVAAPAQAQQVPGVNYAQIALICRTNVAACETLVLQALAAINSAENAGAVSIQNANSSKSALAGLIVAAAEENPELAAELSDALAAVAAEVEPEQAAQINAVVEDLAAGNTPPAEVVEQIFASSN